jgi:hypothetical protein
MGSRSRVISHLSYYRNEDEMKKYVVKLMQPAPEEGRTEHPCVTFHADGYEVDAIGTLHFFTNAGPNTQIGSVHVSHWIYVMEVEEQ